MYTFSALNNISTEQLADCFNLAFSDYEQPIRFTPESLKYYLTTSGVNLALSFGAFCNSELVGFILNSNGIYNEQNVVFDAGTGVVPEHRGKKVFSELFEYTCSQLNQLNIDKYYLEVLQANDKAISAYSKKGFSIVREYSVLVAKGLNADLNDEVKAIPYAEFESFPTEISVQPSYEHTTHNISKNPSLYEVLYLDDNAYCIYAKRNGEVIQMHYNTLAALKDVMTALTAKHPSSMAKNVDFSNGDVIAMLKEIGYREITTQYEMVRDI